MQVFSIAPATGRAIWLLPLIPLAVVALVVVIFGMSLTGARSARFEVSPEGLRLRGDMWGRLIPASHLRTGEARRVDLTVDASLRPVRRSMGTGLPGYSSGWFRLANGQRALLYLTDRTRAVFIPTTDEYGVLISPAEPEEFVRALQTIGRR